MFDRVSFGTRTWRSRNGALPSRYYMFVEVVSSGGVLVDAVSLIKVTHNVLLMSSLILL